MENFIDLNSNNIANEHICCAFSDKKAINSYKAKKKWLVNEFDNGYVFRRLNEPKLEKEPHHIFEKERVNKINYESSLRTGNLHRKRFILDEIFIFIF